MKEDYLWDKTGEPDPEIQQLEEILGTLRYQPLQLPCCWRCWQQVFGCASVRVPKVRRSKPW
jgi:hypothetical protein